jgi:hypothetical protein
VRTIFFHRSGEPLVIQYDEAYNPVVSASNCHPSSVWLPSLVKCEWSSLPGGNAPGTLQHQGTSTYSISIYSSKQCDGKDRICDTGRISSTKTTIQDNKNLKGCETLQSGALHSTASHGKFRNILHCTVQGGFLVQGKFVARRDHAVQVLRHYSIATQ